MQKGRKRRHRRLPARAPAPRDTGGVDLDVLGRWHTARRGDRLNDRDSLVCFERHTPIEQK